MPRITGTIERVASKPKETKYGKAYSIGIVVEGEWYNFMDKKDANQLGLEEGASATFVYNDDDYGHKINGKTLKVAESATRKTVPPSKRAGGFTSSGNAGVACGHAINNAVQMAVADGDTTTENVYEHAVTILKLSVLLQGQYDKIVASVNDKPKAKPEPKPEPEVEQEVEQEQEEEEVDFSDEIPF